MVDQDSITKGRTKGAQQREEWDWKQCNRVDWLVEGDRGTKFFSQATKKRQIVNLIFRVINLEGRSQSTIKDLKTNAENFFVDLYKEQDTSGIEPEIEMPRILTNEINAWLRRIPSSEDIKSALSSMPRGKTPYRNRTTIEVLQAH